jgi:hypothetical protein
VLLIASCADKKDSATANTTTEQNTTDTKAAKEKVATTSKKNDHITLDKHITISLQVTKSFLAARNAYNAEVIKELTNPDYKEYFKNKVVELKDQEALLNQIKWAKELDAETKIKEVISQNDSIVEVIEESRNYIDTALGREMRSFKVSYYIKDRKVEKISYDFLPDMNYNNSKNGKLYDEFERYCKMKKIPYSWEATPKDGKILKKALEAYVKSKQ